MAVEQKRGCGYRCVGGLYLVGSYIPVECDRLPYKLESCPVCGAGIHLSRAMTEINPLELLGIHQPCTDKHVCTVCSPTSDPAYIMLVGQNYYTPESFMEEALKQGISKRIPFIPKNMKLGETVVYLAHAKAVHEQKMEPVPMTRFEKLFSSQKYHPVMVPNPKYKKRRAKKSDPIDNETVLEPPFVPVFEDKLGIFAAFRPQRVEKLIWESEATEEELDSLEKRGIKPVVIPDGDPDHK